MSSRSTTPPSAPSASAPSASAPSPEAPARPRALPALTAGALAVSLLGGFTGLALQSRPAPAAAAVVSLGAVSPQPLDAGLVDAGAVDPAAESGDIAARKARARSTAAAATAAAEQAAAAQAAAAELAAQQAAAAQAAEVARAEAERASRAARDADPRAIARAQLAARGQAGQFGCLDRLWTKESGWDPSAENPSSGAYGIPQSLPASKLASAGADWRTNPATQIEWGLGYISDRYGSPCAAWAHSQSVDWY